MHYVSGMWYLFLMNNLYDDYAEPADNDPFEETHFFEKDEEEDEEDQEELRYAEAREDFGFFGEMGLWD